LQAAGRLKLENDIRRAFLSGEFVVHYQPIVDLRSDEVQGVEALLRWNHPERGLLNPEEFIPVAEEVGLIVPMGKAVLEEACRWAVRWQEEYPRISPLLMNVNISAKQLRRPDLITTVEGVLQRTGLDPACLTLDVTETVYVKELERNTAALNDLRRLGVKISIDDFGVGYSSLSYLKRLPADILKLDKLFIEGLGEDLEDTAIVRMIIDLAHTLGIEVIAEGVDGEAVTILKEMGCSLAQGFFFAEPLPPEEVPRYLAA
jgi:EAL domain-containing protein (putative c-di-GMP-specific phosphodiesterase class I)